MTTRLTGFRRTTHHTTNNKRLTSANRRAGIDWMDLAKLSSIVGLLAGTVVRLAIFASSDALSALGRMNEIADDPTGLPLPLVP